MSKVINLRLEERVIEALDAEAAREVRSRNYIASGVLGHWADGQGGAPKIARAAKAVVEPLVVAGGVSAAKPAKVQPGRRAMPKKLVPAVAVGAGLCEHGGDPRFCRLGLCPSKRDE